MISVCSINYRNVPNSEAEHHKDNLAHAVTSSYHIKRFFDCIIYDPRQRASERGRPARGRPAAARPGPPAPAIGVPGPRWSARGPPAALRTTKEGLKEGKRGVAVPWEPRLPLKKKTSQLLCSVRSATPHLTPRPKELSAPTEVLPCPKFCPPLAKHLHQPQRFGISGL